MGKNQKPGIAWDDDEYEQRINKIHKKKEKPKQGIQEEFDLSNWEREKQKTNSRRENKKKDKDRYYDDYDDKWN